MHDAGDSLDTSFEHAKRRRVGQHDARRCRPHGGAQCVDIDIAIAVRRHFADYAATHRRRGRVGAVGGVRNDNFAPFGIAACVVISHDHRDAGEFALCACHRRQRHTLHAGHFFQHFLQLEHATEITLAVLGRRQRVAIQKARQHRQRVTGPRVVLHRARPERVELRVDAEILLRQARVVTHDVELGDGRQAGIAAASQCRWQRIGRKVAVYRESSGPTARRRVLEDQGFVADRIGHEASVRSRPRLAARAATSGWVFRVAINWWCTIVSFSSTTNRAEAYSVV